MGEKIKIDSWKHKMSDFRWTEEASEWENKEYQ